MKSFPNLVFPEGSFDCLFFFNLPTDNSSGDFAGHVLRRYFDQFKFARAVSLLWSEDSVDRTYADLHNSEYENRLFFSGGELLEWVMDSSRHGEEYLVTLGESEIQIYKDLHSWDIIVIGVREKHKPDMIEYLQELDVYEKRMTSLDTFEQNWSLQADPEFLKYALNGLAKNYMPFIL
jgi:hypothetical protein